MLTRCPACSTTFRVTPEQLKARSGRVRCGRCDHRFNALDALQEEAPVFIPAPHQDHGGLFRRNGRGLGGRRFGGTRSHQYFHTRAARSAAMVAMVFNAFMSTS